MSGFAGNIRWRPITGNKYDITFISASIHDSNEIPTAMHMFPWSSHETRLSTSGIKYSAQ